MAPQPTTPQPIAFETARFRVRDLDLADASERACAWLADPLRARMINAPPRALTLDEFRRYIASHDRMTSHLLGVFAKAGGAFVGFWSAYIDWEIGEFQVSVLIGERGRHAAGARSETQRELLRHLFDDRDLATLRCSVLARNGAIGDRVFAAAGLNAEHTSRKPSATEPAFVEIRHYRVARTTWHALRRRAAADKSFADQIGV